LAVVTQIAACACLAAMVASLAARKYDEIAWQVAIVLMLVVIVLQSFVIISVAQA
jgi:hypothetical protein